jgi:hypothetical protein
VPQEILAGLDQGCSLSLVGYIIYNAPALEATPRDNRSSQIASCFIDDLVYLARGNSFANSNNSIKHTMEKPNGFLEGSKTHNCEIEYNKCAIVGFSKQLEPKPFQLRKRQPIPWPSITIGGHTIKPSTSTKFLGVTLHQSLSWAEQAASALAKGQSWVTQLHRIAKPLGGIPLHLARRLYLSVCVPRMLYTIDIWDNPSNRRKSQKGHKSIAGSHLAKIHWQALLCLGSLRTTASDILEAHTNLPPFHLLVDKLRLSAVARLATLPPLHPLHSHIGRAHRHLPRWHQTPLHCLLADFHKVNPETMEKIHPFRWHSPKALPPFHTDIQEKADSAIARLQQMEADITILYTLTGQHTTAE